MVSFPSPFSQKLVRTGGIDVGILLAKAEDDDDETPGATTHWVVSVEGSDDEETVSEKALGRVLEAHDSDDNTVKSTIEKAIETTAQKKTVAKKAAKTKTKTNSQANRKIKTRAASKGKGGSSAFEELSFVRKAPPPKPKKVDGDDNVLEVKMNTGTLFIYRGKNRRVEFVRTI